MHCLSNGTEPGRQALTLHDHKFATPAPAAPLDVPEWKMSTTQWVAHQQRLYGPNWRARVKRMDGEAADAAFYGCVGSEAYDAAPDLTAHARSLDSYIPAVSL